MAIRPHNVSDLQLAPVVLALESRLDELAPLTPAELADQVAILGDKPRWTRELRETGLLSTISRPLELHDWEISWCSRGLRVSNGTHHITLGIPATFDGYLDQAHADTARPVASARP
jgi:hypothetical protein